MSMCIIPPENLGTLKFFGTVLLCGGIVSLIAKATYFRGLIRRSEQPRTYWFVTLWMLGFGSFILIARALC